MLYYRAKIEGETYEYSFEKADEGFVDVAKLMCFSDCCPYEDLHIELDGREVEYTGWQPDMIMEFAYVDNGEVVYGNQFCGWEH